MKRNNYIKSILTLFTLAIIVIGAAGAGHAQVQFRNKLDFNGDGKADVALYSINTNTAQGSFYLSNSPNNAFRSVQWGSTQFNASDRAVPGDFDGDGKGDFAVFRRDGGTGPSIWYILNNAGTSSRAVRFGFGEDTLVPADYDGDGKDDVAVARRNPANNTITYYWLRSLDGQLGFRTVAHDAANAECRPSVPGDYNADGRADFVVRCRQISTNNQYFDITDNVLNTKQRIFWGIFTADNGSGYFQNGDVFVPGDYDGDGKTDIAVVRLNPTASNSGSLNWYIRRSSTGTLQAQTYGAYLLNVEAGFTDQPAPADYDGDGKTDISVQRLLYPRVEFYIQSSLTGASRGLTFGYSLGNTRDDVALPIYFTSFPAYSPY